MQTRERFNSDLGSTVFSPSERRTGNESNLRALFSSHLPHESTFIHVLFVHSRWMPVSSVIRISIAKSQPAGVRDVTWHGRHAYI